MAYALPNLFPGLHVWQMSTVWRSPVSRLFNSLLGRGLEKNSDGILDSYPITTSSLNGYKDARLDNLSIGRWIWAAIKEFAIYITEHIIGIHPHEVKTVEKVLRFNDRGRFLKRSLWPDEFAHFDDGEPFVPVLVVERLKNEAACMSFIREHTDIPVPKLLEAYDNNGSYHVWMEFVTGVELNKLTKEQQAAVFPEVQKIVDTMQKLRSNRSGGPTALQCPPSVVYLNYFSAWGQQHSPEQFVFCHGDLSQDNILVDPSTLKIVAIIDWEYAGFYPPEHEIPYYKSSKSSGEQSLYLFEHGKLEKIIAFWERSQISTS